MIGRTLGPYKILEPLGSGGMGEVYLAEDTRLKRKMAIKVLPALILALAVPGLLCAAAGATLGVPTAQEAAPIFNGRDLSGWRIHGTELWYVENGELVCESGPDAEYGYLATERTYTDFELTLEFLQEADGNSGVFFRSSLDGTRITGWQVEVAPPGSNTGGVYESYGRGWLIQPAEDLPDVNIGEWNTMRVRVVGDRVTSWLNGVQMIDLSDETIGQATGVIALQIHSGGGIKVRWRNLMVREIG